MNDETQSDYIIVGAGSAGCVLASRLTEDGKTRVLLLEAGGDSRRMLVDMPAGLFRLMGDPVSDWMYDVEPDASRGGHRQVWSGGRMLGGSSAINAMVYVRGERNDYDDWRRNGCPGWGADEVWPYFLKAERFNGPPSQDHGRHGPLGVSPVHVVHPLARAFVSACDEIGLPKREDYCAGDQTGAFLTWTTTEGGQRTNAYKAYVWPARRRPNLQVLTGAEVDLVDVEGGRAVGVRGRRDGQPFAYRAKAEVILCAGAIGSPTLLLRSGIGPAADLNALGIAPVANLPVGRNLQEHGVTPISKLVDVATYNMVVRPLNLLGCLMNYMVRRSGPLTSAAVQAMAYARTSPELSAPDVCFSFLPLAMDISDRPTLHKQSGVTISAQICRPLARGTIRLRNPSPGERPIIDFPMLAEDGDLETLIAAARMGEQMFAAPAMAAHVVARNQPGRALQTDDDWRAYIRDVTGIGYHPVGTCRMGSDDRSVVDPTLKVRGVDGLRIVDASIMPRITSGNTNAPTIMIAERAVDLIRA